MTWKARMLAKFPHDLDEDSFNTLYLEPRDGCVPDYMSEEYMKGIIQIFYFPLAVICDAVAPELRARLSVIVEPDNMDTSFYSILDLDNLKILYYERMKAWNHVYDSLEDFEKWCDEIADTIRERLNIKPDTFFNYECLICDPPVRFNTKIGPDKRHMTDKHGRNLAWALETGRARRIQEDV